MKLKNISKMVTSILTQFLVCKKLKIKQKNKGNLRACQTDIKVIVNDYRCPGGTHHLVGIVLFFICPIYKIDNNDW